MIKLSRNWLLAMYRLFLVLWLAACGTVAQSQEEAERVGSPWTGEPGIRESTRAIMERDNSHNIRSADRIHARGHADFQNLPNDPQAPRVENWPAPGVADSADATTTAAQSPGLGFTAATLADTQAFPPDCMGAVGPSQFVLAVNGRIRSFDKQTGLRDGVLDADMDIFFQTVMTPPVSNNFTSDPRIRYDRLSQRWFVTIIDVPGKSGALPNRILLAVSDGPILRSSTVWTFFHFQHDLVSPVGDSGKFADYPTLGVDRNALYMGVNIFGTRGQGGFSDTTGFVIRKSSVLGAGPIVVTAFRNLVSKVQGINTGPYTPQGVDNPDPASNEGYFIGADAGVFGRLALRRVSNPGGTPSISANTLISIPLNGGTISVPHLGNTGGVAGNLDGLDYRLIMAQMRDGHLWTSENIAVNNTGAPSGTDSRIGVRWYELSGIASGQTPAVVQSGIVYQPSAANTTDQRNYWMGSVNVSGQGHAVMGFSVAGANEHINAGYAGRLAGDAPGTMREPVLFTSSSSAYNPPSDPGSAEGRRWGDYSYTSVDPDDDMTMWTVQQFCDSANSYGVRVLRILAPAPATPIDSSPATINSGAANVDLTVRGLSTNGSGFFDPGASFSNHIAGVFSGSGITVHSIRYVNPTNLSLNISAASGASGARFLTVRNPDGQSATSSGPILNVIAQTPPKLIDIAIVGGTVRLRWSATAGKNYRVQFKDALTLPTWQTAAGQVTATSNVATKTEPLPPGSSRFYRICLID